MAASVARDVRDAVTRGTLRAPAADNALIAPAAPADLALATANVLVDADLHGHTYDLTCPTPITWTDLAALASDIASRPIDYEPITDHEFREQVARPGIPAVGRPPRHIALIEPRHLPLTVTIVTSKRDSAR